MAIVMAMLTTSLVVLAGSSLGDEQGPVDDVDLGAGVVPGAPRNLVADQGPGFVWLWWDHPTTNGDDLIKRYYIFRGPTSGGESTTAIDWVFVGSTTFEGTDLAGVNFYNDTDVTLDTTYFYRLTASSDAGNSSYSNEVSATPSMTGDAPGAPGVVGQNQVYQAQVNWTEPATQGSTPVRFYFLYRDPVMFFGTLVEEWTLDTGYTDEVGFFTQIGVDYTYTVTAVNSYGQGAEGTAIVNIGGTGDTPSAPTNLTAFGMNQSALLAWDKPVNPSASGFDKYELFRAPAQGGPWVSIQNISTVSFTGYIGLTFDSDLTNGVTYYYQVQAVRTAGPDSGLSNIANATPMSSSVVFAVDTLTAYPGDGKVLLMWDSAYNETDPADAYDIYRSTTAGAETFLISVGSDEHYFDTDVVNGETYFYKVKPKIDASGRAVLTRGQCDPRYRSGACSPDRTGGNT